MSHLPCAREVREGKKFLTSQCFTQSAILRVFKEFVSSLILANNNYFTCFWGFFLNKNPHKCNINTQNEYHREYHLCKLPELMKNQAEIQVFEITTQHFATFLDRTLNKEPCLKLHYKTFNHFCKKFHRETSYQVFTCSK